jgi:hypothetical protein
MNNRGLAKRLERVEASLRPPERVSVSVRVHFVEPGGEITGGIIYADGKQTRWYAPGHEPDSMTPIVAEIGT